MLICRVKAWGAMMRGWGAAVVGTMLALTTAGRTHAETVVLPHDTPVRLMVMTEVSTRDRHPGDRFRLTVNEAVTAGGRTLIPVGTNAWGEVVSAEGSGSVGKSGQLRAKLLHIDLKGVLIPITGETDARGGSATGQTVMAVIGLGLVGLFARGNNARIKAGELITAFTTSDVALPVTGQTAP